MKSLISTKANKCNNYVDWPFPADILNFCVFLKVLAKRNSFLYLRMTKKHNVAIVTLGFSPRPLLLAISANPVKGFKCLTKIKQDQNSYCSRGGITICHIEVNLVVKVLKKCPQDYIKCEPVSQLSIE